MLVQFLVESSRLIPIYNLNWIFIFYLTLFNFGNSRADPSSFMDWTWCVCACYIPKNWYVGSMLRETWISRNWKVYTRQLRFCKKKCFFLIKYLHSIIYLPDRIIACRPKRRNQQTIATLFVDCYKTSRIVLQLQPLHTSINNRDMEFYWVIRCCLKYVIFTRRSLLTAKQYIITYAQNRV